MAGFSGCPFVKVEDSYKLNDKRVYARFEKVEDIATILPKPICEDDVYSNKITFGMEF